MINRSGEFDIVHSHADHFLWLAGDSIRAPRVATLHGRLDAPETRTILNAHPDQPLISISDSQRKPTAGLHLNWAETVPHGLDLAHTYRLGRGAGGYLVFLGRISPEKDPITAIRGAIRSGFRLKIAARVDPADEVFFREQVRPLFGHPLIEWLGEQNDDRKAALLADAARLLLPIDWEEPFGLAFIEASRPGRQSSPGRGVQCRSFSATASTAHSSRPRMKWLKPAGTSGRSIAAPVGTGHCGSSASSEWRPTTNECTDRSSFPPMSLPTAELDLAASLPLRPGGCGTLDSGRPRPLLQR